MKQTVERTEWQVEVDRVSAGEWSRLLDDFEGANFYQTFSYGSIRWGNKNLSHIVLKRGDEVAAMAQLRIMQSKSVRLGIAYLRWGPLWVRRHTMPNAEVVRRMAEALEQEYVQQRGLALRVLPNAFIGSERAEAMRAAFQHFTLEPIDARHVYRTILLDLLPPLQELRRNFDRKWRNQLTSAERKPLRVTMGTSTDEFSEFCVLYREMRERKHFESAVDAGEFARIQEDLPESQRMQVFLCHLDRAAIAGAVISSMGDSAIYLLGATTAEGRAQKASYLLQWQILTWLKDRGVRWYDLGGIDHRKNPGVHHFKSGMSGEEACHLGPLVASKGVLSSKVIATGLAIHRALAIRN